MGSPEFGSGHSEGLTALEEQERLELSRELAQCIEVAANMATAEAINGDPMLHAMLSKLIEGGPELYPPTRAHLRKMIALHLHPFDKVRQQAAIDVSFFDATSQQVQQEVEELKSMEGLENLPDLWDIALQDLLRLDDD